MTVPAGDSPGRLVVSPIHDAVGVVVGTSSIARDATALGRERDQARPAAQYARSLIVTSRDPQATISAAGKITDVNEATVRVTGAGAGPRL